MGAKIANDPRIDPRIKRLLGALPDPVPMGDAQSRAQLLEEENSDAAKMRAAGLEMMHRLCDNEDIAP
jgi:hypothetical protein